MKTNKNIFNTIGLQIEIQKAIKELGFEKPTLIQERTIPHLMASDQDIIATAQTGTGKTAAFGLPSIQLTKFEDKKTQTLILCPTRELCVQITKDLNSYSKYIKGINIVAVYGGANIESQMRAIKKGAQIVVGTPGRTKDLIKRKKLILKDVKRVILDEADEMLSMGFKEDLETILSKTPDKKQTLLFSATMSKRIIAITTKYMNDSIKISVSKMNMGAENVKHIYYMVHSSDRYEVLKRIADSNPNIYGISFCRTRRETKEVANKLMNDGYNADTIHGDLSQAQRDEVMGKFRQGRLQILVATDVAARGLDVTNLTHIINYNLPDDPEVYIHRSGRTGRAGKSGVSIAIIHTRDMRKIKDIEKLAGITFSRELVPSGKDICKKQLFSLIDKIEKVNVDESQIEPFLPDIYSKLEWLDREQLIKHFVSAEFNRFLSYYKNSKDINISGKNNKREKRKKSERRKTPFSTIYINIGSKNKLNPARLMGLINEALGNLNAVIGKIDIKNKFSLFEIEDKKKEKLIKGFKNVKFDGISISIEISNEKLRDSFSSGSGKKRKKRRNGNNRFKEKTFKKNKGNRKKRYKKK
jgi:ATP-dependent RNA helicase DeaD